MLLLSLDPKSGRILIESSSLHENCFKSIHTYSRVLLICETINFGKRMFCQMVQIKFGCWLRLWFAKISCTMLRRTLDASIQNFALKLFEMDFTYQLRWKDKSQNHHLKIKIHCHSAQWTFCIWCRNHYLHFSGNFLWSWLRVVTGQSNSVCESVCGNGFVCQTTLGRTETKLVLTWHKLNLVGRRW